MKRSTLRGNDNFFSANNDHGRRRDSRLLSRVALAAGIAGMAALPAAIAWVFLHPPRRLHRRTPLSALGIPYQRVRLHAEDGVSLSAWFVPPPGGLENARGVVVLSHGYFGFRETMFPYLDFLYRAGYAVLLFDFRAHGWSGGHMATFGRDEPLDLRAALDWVENNPELEGLPLALIGESMGASVSLLLAAEDPRVAAVVADCPYARFESAVESRLELIFGASSTLIAPGAKRIGERMLGLRLHDLAPVEAIKHIAPRPVLLIHGQQDALIKVENSRKIHAAAPETTTLWEVPDAGHARSVYMAPNYGEEVVAFLEANLPPRLPAMYFGDTSRTGRPFAKDPSVIRHGGRYLMYYSLPPYTPERMPPNGAPGWGIGIAESHDLIQWTRIGEILPEAGTAEEKGICAPGARVLHGKVHLFYQTYGNGPKDAICHAVSTDGIHFERDASNPVFHPQGRWNIGRAIDAEVYPVGDKVYLYYATRDPEFKVQMVGGAVADAESDFSRSAWKDINLDGPMLKPEEAWEQDCIEAPTLCRHNGRLYMFYAGAYNNAPQQIGCAVSDDGIRWQRISPFPVLGNGIPGAWNSSESGHPGVFQDDDGRTYLFYQGNSDNGKTWLLSRKTVTWNSDGLPVLED